MHTEVDIDNHVTRWGHEIATILDYLRRSYPVSRLVPQIRTGLGAMHREMTRVAEL